MIYERKRSSPGEKKQSPSRSGTLAPALIFDMDGTLWDSAKEVASSWSEVFKKYPSEGLTHVTTEDLQSVMGHTMTSIEEDFFPDTDPALRHRILTEAGLYENDYLRAHGGRLYPGVKETLASLRGSYPLLIESNCQSGYIEAFLSYYGFGPYFTDHLCFGDIGKGKADGLKELVRKNGLKSFIYIGDIQGDYDATIEAGGLFLHAAWGFGEVVPAPGQAPVIEVPEFADIPEAVRKVL